MAQQQQTMFVVIPAGVGPGQTFFVNTTSGQQVTVTVPPGCASGQQIQISVPTVLAAVPVVPANMGGGATKTGISGTGYDPDIMKKTRDLFEVPKTGTTVSAAMPTAPPLSSIDDTKVFDESGYQLESDAIPSAPPTSSVEEVSACVPVSEGTYFWTPQEMAQLQQQPLPLEYFKPTGANDAGAVSLPVANGIVVANDPSQVISQPVFVAGNGLPIVTRAVSGAETEYDGYKGVKSCDPILQNNVDEIMLFLQTHNTRPKVACRIWLYHQEQRTRQVSHTDSDGRTHWRTETYYVTVTDADYKVDLTNFVFPYGYIQSVRDADKDGKPDPIPDIIRDFIEDENKLKTLSMKKANFRVRVWQSNCLSDMWENSCCKCLCYVTIIPCIIMRCYRDCGGHKEQGIQSHFRIDYAPIQVFDMIRPALWCPGYGAMDLMGEMYRSVFW
eukprot:g1706.t1